MSGGVVPERITHGRHCTCSACAREDWTRLDLAPCGMHGPSCPRAYDPWGEPGTYRGGVVPERERAVELQEALRDALIVFADTKWAAAYQHLASGGGTEGERA